MLVHLGQFDQEDPGSLHGLCHGGHRVALEKVALGGGRAGGGHPRLRMVEFAN